MNYSNFNFRAVVDWIEISIHTVGPTHYDAIKRHSGQPFVEPMNPANVGKSASVFRIKIHDPANWHEITGAVAVIAKKFPLAEPFKVVGIEVAFDAYGCKEVTPEELAALVANFCKYTTYSNANRRIYRELGAGAFAPPSNHGSAVRKFAEGWQVGVGDKDSDCYQHLYLKTTDHNKRLLLDGEHRARIEITLRGNKLPCSTLEEWAKFNYASLARPYFSFRKLRDDLTPLQRLTADANISIGSRNKRNRSGGGTRQFNKTTRADIFLNDAARNKLRDLSSRWQGQKTATSKVTMNKYACGNAGDSNTNNPCNDAKVHHVSNNYIDEEEYNKILKQVLIDDDEYPTALNLSVVQTFGLPTETEIATT